MGQRSLILVLLAVLVLFAGATGVYAYDRSHADELAAGVTVAGVDVGGMTAADAEAALRRRVRAPLERPIAIRHGAGVLRLSPAHAQLRIGIAGMVRDALRASRSGDPISRAVRDLTGGEADVDVPARVSFSRRAVRRFVDRASRRIDRSARDATVEASGGGLRKVSGRNGVALKQGELERALARGLGDPASSRALDAPVEVTRPRVALEELENRYPYYITVDRKRFRLHFYRGLRLVKTYVIAVGRIGFETPEGIYHIQNKAVNPVWSVPNRPWAGALAGKVIPPGPDNPIKARWMGIYDGAGIHGTEETSSLGSAASRGCIRMSIPDVKELYEQVPVRTPVYIG